mmetsp:Transcript_5074/g.11798  ORF Transcript_5074/g.11798 Transcript_5074/m.11798 type:complete len:210 (-) Transcript_5074:266-895(-)|eukprot:CAMPEP_0114139594 /NCGR_PEP_ID=MMETSP0043_2-20121206/16939_1 /TAXON_ID=464988 /ORGANISM="Hemiselmis andersenii, Strain CCMP644" /LENGTH=209 /DNA_ID=CAMNT_0001233641 /DNA_START=50 /DNA_END=679 /DNA_ORIENTATION=-
MGSVLGIIAEETPKHTVIHSTPHFNVRRYESYLLAETKMSGKGDGPPFQALARYIGVFATPENQAKQAMAMTAPVFMTTGNEKGEKIAMTAPVLQSGDAQCGDDRTMSFVLPSKYTLETAPTPTNPSVQLRQVPARTCAVHKFSGRYRSMAEASEKADWLCKQLVELGFTPDPNSKWDLAQYNPPWTLPFLRTNEIHVPLSGLPDGVKV